MMQRAESDSPPTPRRPGRRFLRYSLRTLLLVTLVLSIWLGWMANRAAKQRRAVGFVKELRGVILYDFQIAYQRHAPNRDRITISDLPQHPERLLVDVLGRDWLCDVQMVLLGHNATDAQVREILDGVPNVMQLHLADCEITDETLEKLATLDELRYVRIRSRYVTAEGVKGLEQARPNLNVNYTPKGL